LNEGIRGLMRGVTLADVLTAYEKQKADCGIFDYTI
jgi:hypothetical protein